MEDFIQITTGTIMILFTVEQVFITDTTGIHRIIPTILILHIIMIITTPLIITEIIIHIMAPDTTIIICLIILIIQIVAIPGAHVMAKLATSWGNFNTLMVAVLIWIGGCVMGYLLPRNDVYLFYVLAVIVGFVMGGIQSVSRSTYSKLMPVTYDTASFFSFFDVTEKIAIVIGMFSFGFINELTGSQRNSVLVLGSFFVIGLALLYRTAQYQKNATA